MLYGGLQGRLVFDIHLHHVQPVVPSSSFSEGVQTRSGGGIPAGRNHRSCTHDPSENIVTWQHQIIHEKKLKNVAVGFFAVLVTAQISAQTRTNMRIVQIHGWDNS